MAKKDDISGTLELLSDARSAKRRSGAKRLRKLKDPSHGQALIKALQKELQDPRTWETQYQMIMALGECGYKPALPLLRELQQQHFEATMVYVALGDAIVRLGRTYDDDPSPVLLVMETGNEMLIDGAFRAVAMLRLKLNDEAIRTIIGYLAKRGSADGLRFWVAAAAAGWDGPEVEPFLRGCVEGSRDDVKKAAEAARQKRYLKWNPL